MTRGNVLYLEEHGPATLDELPHDQSVADKMQGMRVFKISGDNGASAAMGGNNRWVYYLDEHERTSVIRRYLEANSKLVDNKPKKGLHRQIGGHGSSWLEAAREVTPEFYEEE